MSQSPPTDFAGAVDQEDPGVEGIRRPALQNGPGPKSDKSSGTPKRQPSGKDTQHSESPQPHDDPKRDASDATNSRAVVGDGHAAPPAASEVGQAQRVGLCLAPSGALLATGTVLLNVDGTAATATDTGRTFLRHCRDLAARGQWSADGDMAKQTAFYQRGMRATHDGWCGYDTNATQLLAQALGGPCALGAAIAQHEEDEALAFDVAHRALDENPVCAADVDAAGGLAAYGHALLGRMAGAADYALDGADYARCCYYHGLGMAAVADDRSGHAAAVARALGGPHRYGAALYQFHEDTESANFEMANAA